MNCPVCDKPMEAGGIIFNGNTPYWVPVKDLKKKGLIRKEFHALKTTAPDWLRRSRLEKAYLCSRCKKIVGIFDVVS